MHIGVFHHCINVWALSTYQLPTIQTDSLLCYHLALVAHLLRQSGMSQVLRTGSVDLEAHSSERTWEPCWPLGCYPLTPRRQWMFHNCSTTRVPVLANLSNPTHVAHCLLCRYILPYVFMSMTTSGFVHKLRTRMMLLHTPA